MQVDHRGAFLFDGVADGAVIGGDGGSHRLGRRHEPRGDQARGSARGCARQTGSVRWELREVRGVCDQHPGLAAAAQGAQQLPQLRLVVLCGHPVDEVVDVQPDRHHRRMHRKRGGDFVMQRLSRGCAGDTKVVEDRGRR